MKVDFLTLLNDSNCIKNTKTHEFIINSPLIEAEGNYQITCPMKISSSSNTLIKCDIIEVCSASGSFTNISFEANFIIEKSNHFTLQNCTIKNSKKVADSAISIAYSQNVLMLTNKNRNFSILLKKYPSQNLFLINLVFWTYLFLSKNNTQKIE